MGNGSCVCSFVYDLCLTAVPFATMAKTAHLSVYVYVSGDVYSANLPDLDAA